MDRKTYPHLVLGVMIRFATNSLYTTAKYGPTLLYGMRGLVHLILPPVKNKTLVQEKFQKLFSDIPTLRTDIELLETSSLLFPDFADVGGTNFTRRARILFEASFPKEGQEALNFLLKRQVSHILTSSDLIASGLAMVSSLVSIVTIPILLARLPWWLKPVPFLIPQWVGRKTYHLAMREFERRADDFAVQHATDQEIQEIKIFYEAEMAVHKEKNLDSPHKATAEGNIFPKRDPTHDPLIIRLQKVLDELKRRNLTLDSSSPVRLECYKEFYRKSFSY